MRATLRSLNEMRWTAAAFCIAGFAVTFLQSVAFFRLAGRTFADHAAFGYSLLLDATANADLFPPPIHPETVAGYLELRAFTPLAILFAAWALLTAIGPAAAPIVPRAIAFAISTVVAAAAACAGVVVGVASGGQSVGAAGLAEAGLLLAALALACYSISLLVARVGPDAPSIAAGVLLFLFFLNSLSRTFSVLEAPRWISPFRYYDLSTPLPPGGRFDAGGLAALLVIAVGGIALATIVAGRPRPTKPAMVRASYEPSRARLLTVPVTRDLFAHRLSLGAWSVAFAALGVVLVAATRTTMQDLLALPRGLPGLHQYLFTFFSAVLSQMWFDVTALLFVGLVFVFARCWASEDRNGRLEAELSAPYSRSALIVERLAALAVTAMVLAAAGGLGVGLTSLVLDLNLDVTRLVEACALLVLFAVVFGAVGLLLTSWVSRAATTALGAVALASYLDDQVGAALQLPGWAQSLSPFRLVDAPLVNGVDGRNLAILVLLTLAVVGSSILLMQRHDVGVHSPTKGSQART